MTSPTATSTPPQRGANSQEDYFHVRTSPATRQLQSARATLDPNRHREWSLFETVLLDHGRSNLSASPASLFPPFVRGTLRRRPGTPGSLPERSSPRDVEPLTWTSEPAPIFYSEARSLENSQSLSPDAYASDTESEHSFDSSLTETSSTWTWIPTFSILQRDILKCSLAYAIGSLFTFVPYLSSIISFIIPNNPEEWPSASAHMVATIAVYFNPAKSLGAMHEADIYCLVSALFAAFVSLASMDTFWFFEIRPGWEWLADALTFTWIAIAISVVAWVKLWMNKPSFSPACSMTVIIIFVTTVKEGGLQTLLQVSFIVFIGCLISNVICVTLWPRSATAALQQDMFNTLTSFATLLRRLTQAFLLEENMHPNHDTLLRAIKDHQASFTSLKKSRNEAKSEWWNSRIQRPSAAYDAAVESMTRLAQHLAGLRTGLNLEFQMSMTNSQRASVAMDDDARVEAVAKAFGDLVDDLGPPMNALASACARTLRRIRESFVLRRDRHSESLTFKDRHSHDFDQLSNDIGRALFTFERTSRAALIRLYSREELEPRSADSQGRPQKDESESMYLVYFFIFTLQEFARELLVLVEAMSIIYTVERSTIGWWATLRTWLTRWPFARRGESPRPTLKKSISNYIPEGRLGASNTKLFPRIEPHAPNTVLRPPQQSLTAWGRQEQRLWVVLNRLKQPDMKYAIKTGLGTAILALPAFINSSRPLFVQYHSEWALLSFFVVMSRTIGATNFLSYRRVLGTLLGAGTAAAISSLFPDKPIILSIFGFFFSIPCFYIIVGTPQYATSGRFILLTYNLTCLYCYNLRFGDQTGVWTIAFQRSVSVSVGVLWALIVSRLWWPSEARREFTIALSEFCLNISWLYTALVRAYISSEVRDIGERPAEPSELESTSLLMRRDQSSILRFMEMELHLQLKLLELQGLLSHAQNEPRLKGPFPVQLYRAVLTSLQTILDNLHSMRCVTTREEWRHNVHAKSAQAVNKERREMVGNVILYFSMLAAAFGLKTPVSPYLPPAEEARQRLVDAIRKLDSTRSQEEHSKQLLYIAYGLMMKGVIGELNFLGKTLQDSFGVVGCGPEDFDSLFQGSQ